jgi:hypothetical protein
LVPELSNAFFEISFRISHDFLLTSPSSIISSLGLVGFFVAEIRLAAIAGTVWTCADVPCPIDTNEGCAQAYVRATEGFPSPVSGSLRMVNCWPR